MTEPAPPTEPAPSTDPLRVPEGPLILVLQQRLAAEVNRSTQLEAVLIATREEAEALRAALQAAQGRPTDEDPPAVSS